MWARLKYGFLRVHYLRVAYCFAIEIGILYGWLPILDVRAAFVSFDARDPVARQRALDDVSRRASF